jgi:transposase
VTLLAYRYALNPTPAQERDLRSQAGAARVAFNWGLARVRAVMDQRAGEATYPIAGDDLTPSMSWSLYWLRKSWNAVKGTVSPWWAECSKEAFGTGLDQLPRAMKNWGDSRRGKRKGRPVGFPRFRSKRKARPSVRFERGRWHVAFTVEQDVTCPAPARPGVAVGVDGRRPQPGPRAGHGPAPRRHPQAHHHPRQHLRDGGG